ncbi:vesicle transport protein [Gorgonomyces haynaldii]|nr:vesicle transport protein [Gorgonomyces haynaldii]
MCLGASGLCFIMSLFFLPMVILAPGKFALTYTMGSVLFMTSFAVMNGYRAHFKALFGQDRFAFTIVYFMSMILTLYFTVIKPLYFMIILCTVVQFVALAWYLASYLPGGTQSLRWMTRNTIGLPV